MPEPWTPERIKALRGRLNIPNQNALAARLGTSQQVVSGWENGHTKPRADYIHALEVLNAETAEPPTEKDRALWTAAGQLATAAVAFVVAFRGALRGASDDVTTSE